MAIVKHGLLVTQRVHGECATHTLTKISVRDVGLTVDEPTERGGSNLGPAPAETMVASLVACTNVIGHKCAAKHGVDLVRMTVDAEATFDRRGVTLQEEIEVPFPEIQLTIRVTTGASDDRLALVKTDLRRFCPVTKVLQNAGTNVHDTWIVDRP